MRTWQARAILYGGESFLPGQTSLCLVSSFPQLTTTGGVISHCAALPLAFLGPWGEVPGSQNTCLPDTYVSHLPVPITPPPALAFMTQLWWLLSLFCQCLRRLCQSEMGAISNSILSATDAAWAGPQKNKPQLCGFLAAQL